MDGLVIRGARGNHEIGSPHTVTPVIRFWPSGAPADGDPDPAANGHSPHTCTDVPRHIVGASIRGLSLPPLTGHPAAGAAAACAAMAEPRPGARRRTRRPAARAPPAAAAWLTRLGSPSP